MAAYANDNIAPISGKAARAWPALARAIRNDDIDAVRALRRFAYLCELADADPGAIPSPAGMCKEDGELALADFVDEVAPDDNGEPGVAAYQIDFTIEYGPTPDRLYELTKAGAYSTILTNGKRGAEHNPNFRIRHVFYNADTDGQRTRTFHSWAEYRGKNGKWHRFEESLKRPRGPKRDNDEWKKWTHTIHPSGNAGDTHRACAAEDRALAIRELEHMRETLGDDLFEALRQAAVEHLSGQEIGEQQGKTHKGASALGGKLIKSAVAAANDNWKLAESA